MISQERVFELLDSTGMAWEYGFSETDKPERLIRVVHRRQHPRLDRWTYFSEYFANMEDASWRIDWINSRDDYDLVSIVEYVKA